MQPFCKFFIQLLLICTISSTATLYGQIPGRDGPRVVYAVDTVINIYTALTSDALSGATQINVSSAVGFAANDFIMIYQPQGATISTVNDSTYGVVTALNNSGFYEFRTVTSKAGNKINLSSALTHSYNIAGKAQIVRVPQYSSLTVLAGGSIAAQAWNGTTGGIAAAHVQNTATINGSIHANARGFRGGAVDNLSVMTLPNAISIYRTTVADSSAEKGESIAGLASMLAGGQYGRGAPANGGGGGNSHNAGGGGGSNGNNGNSYTGHGVMSGAVTGASAWTLDPGWFIQGGALANSSGGGRGGYSYSANDVNALVQGPGLAAWGGDYRQERGGHGGHPLNNDASNRVFFGGGGGAGDGNNSCAGAGGIGGGLVFLLTTNLAGTGSMSANAGDGNGTTGAGNDAPGGGGGGGSVVAWVTGTFSGVALAAKGGAGGNQTIATAETEGPGGGGGGGFITYPLSASPTLNISGGQGGTTTGTSLAEFPRNGATDGASGNTERVAQAPPTDRPFEDDPRRTRTSIASGEVVRASTKTKPSNRNRYYQEFDGCRRRQQSEQ